MQYERRFAELYEQVSSKLEENRKYIGMYNTLDQKRNFMVKQEALMDSINSQFEEAMSSKKTRPVFLGQLEKIVAGIQSNLDKQVSSSFANLHPSTPNLHLHLHPIYTPIYTQYTPNLHPHLHPIYTPSTPIYTQSTPNPHPIYTRNTVFACVFDDFLF